MTEEISWPFTYLIPTSRHEYVPKHHAERKIREARNNTTKWTTNPPTEVGWYWMQNLDDSTDMHIEFVFARPGHSYLCIQADGEGRRNFIPVQRLKCKWAGPIQEPEA